MIRRLFPLLLILASLTTAFSAGTVLRAAPAAAVASSHTSLWWDSDTCRAFAAWEHEHTPRRLMSMVRDSRHADTYLEVDVGALYETVRHGLPAHQEAAYVLLDCTTPAD